MKTVQISLNSIDKVKSFVNEVSKYDAEFDLVSDRPEHPQRDRRRRDSREAL